MIRANVFKIILIISNVLLLCAGLTVLILGIKMHLALTVLSLNSILLIQNAVNAIITTGLFISICGLVGLLGACNETKVLLLVHLLFLGVIVILEISICVTLMTMKKSISAAMESSDCNNMCTASFDGWIVDYALPSAGLMMSVIFIEALMIYSSIRLYFFIKDRPRVTVVTGPSIVVQNVQMQNVTGTQAAYATSPQTVYPTPMAYTPQQPQMNYMHQMVPGTVHRSQSDIEDKPPDYDSLSHYPPPYTNEMQHAAVGISTTAEQPREAEDKFNQV